MQTPLDCLEIMQIYYFMNYYKSNYLDLQTILFQKIKKAKNIQKTITFVNNIGEIYLIISIFHFWIKKLGYSVKSIWWIRPYYLAMSEWDKSLIINTFTISANKYTKYTIFVTIDIYDIGIDNLDIKLVIQ